MGVVLRKVALKDKGEILERTLHWSYLDEETGESALDGLLPARGELLHTARELLLTPPLTFCLNGRHLRLIYLHGALFLFFILEGGGVADGRVLITGQHGRSPSYPELLFQGSHTQADIVFQF
eukprot:CAMPEP_0170551850 /NCGR_PEP_ID=MMETSP0211-20121228/9848_1 /TAXON_ID=311385 /ORGANISM="Pseudokeronopsis sp., Strain OXSARD2" /LENGTH=122 /DNA_ID=CAMNT_0010859277 /DNA_START=506 /DNA_END=874 /DNA_ORIENTATION=-